MANHDSPQNEKSQSKDSTGNNPPVAPALMRENVSEHELTGRIRLKETVPLAFFVLILTAGCSMLFYCQFKELDAFHIQESVIWKNRDSLSLNTSPNWIFYNPYTDSLSSSRVITAEMKIQLLGLANPVQKGYSDFKLAVDELAYTTNQSGAPPYVLILIVGGLAATIGVQIRTLFDFIGRACYKKDLKLRIWWPWYVLRIPMGFLLGAVVIVLFDGKIFNPATGQEYSHAFLLGLTVLAGFGSFDVAEMLRNLSKKIFTSTSTDKK